MCENEKTCGNCALWQHDNQICNLFKEPFPPEEHCPKFQKTLQKCSICGQIALNLPVLEYFGTEIIQYCESCAQHMGHCSTCTSGGFCAFKEDTSVKIPPVITQTTRQGNMVIQQQVTNPERIEATCKNCKCFNSAENCCNRIFNCCGDWHFALLGKET